MMVGTSIAWHAIRRERAAFAVTAVALAAVLGPLLVLLGLKNGVVGALLETMRADPSSLEVRFRGHASLTADDIARIAALPGVGFVIPDISSIAATVEYETPTSRGLVRGEAWPTLPGDPLMHRGFDSPDPGGIVVTTALAQRLGTSVGGAVLLTRTRSSGNTRDLLEVPLVVVDVIPPERVVGMRGFVHPDTLDAIQAFVDGYAAPRYGAPGRPLQERVQTYARVRLYAEDLESVSRVADGMATLGYDVTSSAGAVESVLDLDRNLAGLFAAIATIGGVGYLVSFWANLSANLARRRRELSLLRLMGASGRDLVAFALVQGAATAVVGVSLSFAVYGVLALAINSQFVPQGGGSACFLTLQDIQVAGLGSLLVVLVVTLAVSRPLLNVAPSEVLHEA